MQKHYEITRRRVQAFKGLLAERLYIETAPVKISTYVAPNRISFDEAMRGDYRPCEIGEHFGPLWSTHWFKIEIQIPENWRDQEVHFRWDSSSEACIWQDGVPLQGLTGKALTGEGDGGDRRKPIRTTHRLTKSADGSENITLYVEAAINGLFGILRQEQFSQTGLLRQADIATFDRAIWDLLWDYTIVADMAYHLPQNTPRGGQALYAANAMVNQIYPDDRTTWPAAREIAAEYLKARNGDGQHNLSAIGHAHIDTAWLWPLAQTMRKCYRTFSSALLYMEDYPDYRFACSQAQQYAWMKEQQPVLYEKIKAAVAAGRFIPAGGSWVEPDCNLPSGESLVRQFLYGQRFFQQEFGITCREFWLPDTFGYPAALPQIMRGAGIEYFLTQKLSWNQFNKPTSSTFIWEGLDGSQVLVHFPPADTYNANATVEQLLYNVQNFKDYDRANESYYLFGYGDGGGGPTQEMLEQLSRMKDVDGLPRVEIRSPQEFFERCKADAKDLPVWVGELYFELHRGTYTTQARNKLHNRRAETLMHNLEFLATMAHVTKVAPYPSAEIERLWKLILLNQFHDIIPGSSINEVYVDSERDYAEVFEIGENLLNETISALLPAGDELVAINTVGIFRPNEIIEIRDKNRVSPQKAANGNPLAMVSVPPMGWSRIDLNEIPNDQVQVSEVGETFILENKHLIATFRKDGHLVSLFDKEAKREAIEQNQLGNHFVLFDDHPNNWEAWDMDVFHLEKRAKEYESSGNMNILESGPLRASLEFEIPLSGQSVLKQIISLTCTSRYLEFSTEVEWHENRKFLKVEFPLNVRSQYAAYETQYGYIQRPTHFNTTWDIARFEVSAHRWADLYEPGFGVALINDCKYGYATHGNIMRLSLLRSPKSPDDKADMGHHSFRYAVFPHQKPLWEAGITLSSQIFNTPLIIRNAEDPFKNSKRNYFATEWDALHLDSVKKAEDSDAIIVRFYEANGERGELGFSTYLPLKRVFRCNLLEEVEEELEWDEGNIALKIAPFQIITLKIELDELDI